MKTRADIALEATDDVAHRCERKWGVGRLPRLVPINLAEKFWAQKAKLDAAITEAATGGSLANVEYEANRMSNAWLALSATAEAAGAVPLDPRSLEGRLPDGRVLRVCDGPESAWRLAGDDREAVVWSIQEIAQVLWRFEMVNEAKVTFPGARVEEARVDPDRVRPPVDWSKGDPLPFDMLGAG